MVASVQELILAAQARQKPSVFAQLAESAMKGYDQGLDDRDQRVALSMKLIQKKQLEEAIQRKNEAQAMLKNREMQRESELHAAQKAVGGGPTPVLPSQKFQEITELDENGNYSTKRVEIVGGDGTKRGASLEDRLAAEVDAGRMTIKEAYDMKNRSGGGVSTEFLYKLQQDQQKATKEQSQLKVPGFDSTGNVTPKPEEAEKARKAVASFDTFTSGVQRLKNLIDAHGSTIMTGPASGEVASLVADLQIEYKNIAGLGVLSKSDERFLQDVVFNPNGFSSLFTKKGTALSQLDQSLSRSREKLLAGMSSMGYQASDEFNQKHPAKQSIPSGPKVGDVDNGYKFKGGNPADPSSWEKI